MKTSIKEILFFGLLALLMGAMEIQAQTCSCAGAPLISSQSISSAAKGNLLLGVTYQYNDISNLYSGSSQLNNLSTARNTQSTLLELNYGITRRLTFSGTVTYVQKFRRTGLQTSGAEETLTTRGIGDGLFMLKYVLHQNTIRKQYQLAIGGGVKVPFGASDITQGGLALNADMQPGTGAWDGIAWSYFSKTFAPATTINLFWYNSFRLTGSDNRFGSNDIYRFGNEVVSTLGVTNKIIGDLSYIMMVRYRSTASDQRNGNPLPNTGGKWINFKPAFSYGLTDQLSLRFSGQLPVYQHLNGTQPTTAFTLSASVFYNFGSKTIF
ncbi:hypothetical protein [Fodinibius salsisoli]|uniref:MetA-pathway of phenol degradation n=1 Tax=Fodinibius salsisoli TaxID=2820877 RepID=A0ABT3PSE8_9BACT|nr:hypothetical protein [Fodinibius salsisoli]MCW9708783.1 hypothetical protein [Fodinibius salsisoli]